MVQSAPGDFLAANEALKNPLVRGDVFEKIGGNLVVILSGVESGEGIYVIYIDGYDPRVLSIRSTTIMSH